MDNLEHLRMSASEYTSDRKKKTGFSSKIHNREPNERQSFTEESKANIEAIIAKSKEINERLNADDNSLIFNIQVNKKASLKEIEKEFKKMDIDIVSTSENKDEKNVIAVNREMLKELLNKLNNYGSGKHKYNFINSIENIDSISREDKIGKLLSDKPLTDNEIEYLNVEIILNEYTSNNLFEYEKKLKNIFANREGFRITDRLVTKYFALLKIKMNKSILEDILDIPYVLLIDRPSYPVFNISEYSNIDINSFELKKPNDNATGILVIDSGILSNHPMLKECVGNAENFQDVEKDSQDNVGHGTAVAGFAAYGDIKECIDNKIFNPSNFIFSAKVMYSGDGFHGEKIARYDPEKLLESQLKDAIESFLSNEGYNIKCVNISFGNSEEIYKENQKQFALAALIDELALKYNKTVFVISAGNKNPTDKYDNLKDIIDNYPKYFNDDDFKIMNPATSALSITVGSITKKIEIFNSSYGEEKIKPYVSYENEPSIYTRTGPGINSMIKPELIEYGGDLVLSEAQGRINEDKISGKLIVLNNAVSDKIIKYDFGTSFSAPKISHIVGMIANKYPDASSNFIKNLIIASAHIPNVEKKRIDKNELKYIVGYGLPNYDKSIFSYSNRVLLFDENKVSMDQFRIYTIDLPEAFFEKDGNKKIIITITYNPGTRKNRVDYLSNTIKCSLYHTLTSEKLSNMYIRGIELNKMIKKNDPNKKSYASELESITLELNKCKENISDIEKISSGCHQKYIKEYKREQKCPRLSPISIMLENANIWSKKEEQDYCISVIFEHEQNINLYNSIKQKLVQRVRI